MKKILVLVMVLMLVGCSTNDGSVYSGNIKKFDNARFCEYVTYENLYGAVEDLDNFKAEYEIEFRECMVLITELEDN